MLTDIVFTVYPSLPSMTLSSQLLQTPNRIHNTLLKSLILNPQNLTATAGIDAVDFIFLLRAGVSIEFLPLFRNYSQKFSQQSLLTFSSHQYQRLTRTVHSILRKTLPNNIRRNSSRILPRGHKKPLSRRIRLFKSRNMCRRNIAHIDPEVHRRIRAGQNFASFGG